MKARLLLCVLWFSFTQAIAAVPDPAGPISATSSICVGSSGTYVTFSVAPINGATSYQWTPGGGPLTGIGDMTGSTFTVFIAPNYPTPNMNITVRGVNSSGTGLPAPLLTVPVYNSLPAAGPITGATVVNPGQTGVTYSISAVTGALNYIWTFPWGSNSTSTPSITLTFPSNFAGGQIRVYPQNGPCTATSSFIDVTIPTTTPGPAGNISGQTSVCAGSTYSYTVPSIPGATSYEWTPGGGPLAIIGSQTGNTINLQFAAGFDTGTATLVVRGKNGSVTGAPSPTLNITVYRPVTTAGIITGINKVCVPHSNVSYSVSTIPNALSYVWSTSSGMTIVSGQGTQNIVVNYAAGFTSGTLSVVGLAGPCGGGPTATLNVTAVSALPATAGTITGNAGACRGSGGIIYSVASIDRASGYQWSVPAGASITSGQGTTSITVSYSTSASSGNVSVYGTNCVGTGGSSAKAITIITVPAAPGNITGSPNVGCIGTEPYSVTAVPGATGYQWSLPSGATITSGDGTSAIQASFVNSASSGSIKVRASNACGVGAYSPTLPVTKNKFLGAITWISNPSGTGVYVPNVIVRSPGAVWYPTSFGYAVPYNAYYWNLLVINRDGQTVYENSGTTSSSSGFADNSITWNGGSGATGVYFITLKLTNCTNTYTYKGSVSVFNAGRLASSEADGGDGVDDAIAAVEEKPENDFTVYPVPASGSVTLEYYLRQDTDVKIKLVDLIGRELADPVRGHYTKGTHKTIFDVSGFAPSLYYLILETGYSKISKAIPVVLPK